MRVSIPSQAGSENTKTGSTGPASKKGTGATFIPAARN